MDNRRVHMLMGIKATAHAQAHPMSSERIVATARRWAKARIKAKAARKARKLNRR